MSLAAPARAPSARRHRPGVLLVEHERHRHPGAVHQPGDRPARHLELVSERALDFDCHRQPVRGRRARSASSATAARSSRPIPTRKPEYYWLANQGIPIRLRFNPNWFPEIDHWKAAIFVGQNVVEFGSGNFAPTELAPNSRAPTTTTTRRCSRSDPQIVARVQDEVRPDVERHDGRAAEHHLPAPPYLKDWNDACANEPKGCDFSTQYPNPAPMVINTARLEPDVPIPADLIFGQGPDFNNRLTQEINTETTKSRHHRVPARSRQHHAGAAQKFQAGVPVRIIVDKGQYTNPL